MSGHLLDVNVLLALCWPNHQFHAAARTWFAANSGEGWATCAITQLGFVRLSSNPAFSAQAVRPPDAMALLRRLTAHAHHAYIAELPPCVESPAALVFERLMGYRQTTDAYLAALAGMHGIQLATFDRRAAALSGATDWVVHIEL